MYVVISRQHCQVGFVAGNAAYGTAYVSASAGLDHYLCRAWLMHSGDPKVLSFGRSGCLMLISHGRHSMYALDKHSVDTQRALRWHPKCAQ
jgi:hypothetical protein